MLKFISYVPTIAALLIITVLLYVNAGNNQAKRIFSFTSGAMMLWILSLGIADNTTSTTTALFFIRAAIFFANLIPLIFLAFALTFGKDQVGKNRRSKWLIFSIPPLLLALFSFSSQMVESVKIESWGAVLDVTHFLYTTHTLVSLVYFVSAFAVLVLKRKKVDAIVRNQINFILIGSGTAYVANLLSGSILAQSGFQGPAILIGTFSIVVFAAAVAYAIVRGRLFDVRLAAVRVVTFVLSVGFIAATYGFAVFSLTDQFLFKYIFLSKFSQQLFNVAVAVILALTFPRIRRFFEKITDRIFYRDRYDPQHLMSSIGRILATEIALEPLTTKVIRVLEDEMRLADANIVVLGKKGEDGEKDSETEKAIYYQTHGAKKHQDYHIQDLQTIRLPVVITDELASSDERQILEQHHIRAAFALKTRDSQVGYLLLGDKRSGDIYSDQDIQTLRIIADELAVAIQNARAYTEIQRFNVTLREKIDQATHELKHANHELKALDKAKDEFISMASHQLRTPLTAVRGYTSMVMDGDFGKVSGEQKDTLKQAFDAATRMTRLVDDLLNVSRIQSGKFRLERAEVDLNKVLPEEVSLLDTTAKTKQVAITYNAPKTPVPMLLIDEGKTRQCLMNLMDNSIYYSSTVEGGGKVQVYLESDATHVIFRVVDNGIGVPKAQQAKLFKKFYRAPNAQKTRPDGTGLGLFLVGKVVRDQGGEIIFESEEGKGSTFGFKLPIKAAGEGVDASGKVVGAAPVENTKPATEPNAKPPAAGDENLKRNGIAAKTTKQ